MKNIKKLLIHHHDGAPHDLSIKHKTMKASTGEFVPNKYADLATSGEYTTYVYGYHYDVPYVEEKSPDGQKLVVYIMNGADGDSPHTGNGQNEVGIGVSLVGSMRSAEENTEKLNFPHAPAEYDSAPGLPSKNQRKVLPVLVRFLQEKYKIADCHVQAHFQHGKPTCPGYDTERWVIEHEDTSKRAGKAFCYPVALDGGGAPFLKKPADETARAATYVPGTRARGRAGFFPSGGGGSGTTGCTCFQRREPVYAVHDGWVIGGAVWRRAWWWMGDRLWEPRQVCAGAARGPPPALWTFSGKLQDSAKVGRKGAGGGVGVGDDVGDGAADVLLAVHAPQAAG